MAWLLVAILQVKERMMTSFAAFLVPSAQRALVRVQAACRSYLARKRVAGDYTGAANNPLLVKLARTQAAVKQTLWQYASAQALHAYACYHRACSNAKAKQATNANNDGNIAAKSAPPGHDVVVSVALLHDLQVAETFQLHIHEPDQVSECVVTLSQPTCASTNQPISQPAIRNHRALPPPSCSEVDTYAHPVGASHRIASHPPQCP